jgi:RNA polymerase sigma-70 factor (ECF subfamily)
VVERSPPGKPAEGGSKGGPPLESSVELLRRAREGEDHALDLLIERYLPAFRAWATHRFPRYARDALDTDDLVQETLLHTIQQVPGFEPRGDGALLVYMRQALRNRIRDAIRRRQRRGSPVTIDTQEPDARPSPLEQTIGREALERYEAALERLEDHEREAIIARVELKQSWEQVAIALGKPSADAARKTVSRALRRLAEEMSRG